MCGNHIAKRGIWLSVSKVGCEEKTSRPLAGAHGTNSTNGRSSVPHYGGSGCSGNPTPMHQLNKSQKVPILHIPLCFSGIKLGSQTLRFAEALEVWFSGLRLLHSFWSAFGGCEICCTRQFHTCGMERTAKPLFTLTYSWTEPLIWLKNCQIPKSSSSSSSFDCCWPDFGSVQAFGCQVSIQDQAAPTLLCKFWEPSIRRMDWNLPRQVWSLLLPKLTVASKYMLNLELIKTSREEKCPVAQDISGSSAFTSACLGREGADECTVPKLAFSSCRARPLGLRAETHIICSQWYLQRAVHL